jgi:sterol desaturase/sphingolipid hydroxylase (fatty acid hydroxylase superfamily)
MDNIPNLTKKDWWESNRKKYKKGLVVSGITAFLAYAILGSCLIAPYDHEFEITLFTISFQGVGYWIMMQIANLFYDLGYYIDNRFSTEGNLVFSQRLFNLGFWVSVALPFLIPIMIILQYLVYYSSK